MNGILLEYMDTINPQILPASLTKKEHHRAAVVGLWVVLVALLVALIYWIQTRDTTPVTPSVSPPVANTNPDVEAALARFRTSSVTVTEADKAAALKRFKVATPVSEEDKRESLERFRTQ
jgi:hypothetical protein